MKVRSLEQQIAKQRERLKQLKAQKQSCISS
jgi:cell division protein FtsB